MAMTGHLEAHEERSARRERRLRAVIERHAVRADERLHVGAQACAFRVPASAGSEERAHASSDVIEAARVDEGSRIVELPHVSGSADRERRNAWGPAVNGQVPDEVSAN